MIKPQSHNVLLQTRCSAVTNLSFNGRKEKDGKPKFTGAELSWLLVTMGGKEMIDQAMNGWDWPSVRSTGLVSRAPPVLNCPSFSQQMGTGSATWNRPRMNEGYVFVYVSEVSFYQRSLFPGCQDLSVYCEEGGGLPLVCSNFAPISKSFWI